LRNTDLRRADLRGAHLERIFRLEMRQLI